jgi:hypothetical protein
LLTLAAVNHKSLSLPLNATLTSKLLSRWLDVDETWYIDIWGACLARYITMSPTIKSCPWHSEKLYRRITAFFRFGTIPSKAWTIEIDCSTGDVQLCRIVSCPCQIPFSYLGQYAGGTDHRFFAIHDVCAVSIPSSWFH